MSTTIHGPGDPTPQVEAEPDIPTLQDDFDSVLETDKIERMTPAEEALFDPKPYKLRTPVFDNLSSDKLILSLGGPIELDPTNPDDIALFERFTLGRPVTLTVHGYTAVKQGSYREDAEGAVTVTGKAAVKLHSLTLQDG